MYVDDASGKLMSYIDPSGNNSLWMGRLQTNYAAIAKIRICPVTGDPNPWQQPVGAAAVGFGTVNCPWNSLNFWSQTWQGSYGMNGFVYSGDPDPWTVNAFENESAIQSPSKTPGFADAVWVDGWPTASDAPSRNPYSGGVGTFMQRFTIARHGSGGGWCPALCGPGCSITGCDQHCIHGRPCGGCAFGGSLDPHMVPGMAGAGDAPALTDC